MKIYILDDDENVTRIIEKIIEDKHLADLVGISNDSLIALEEINRLRPDIVITDLLMPNIDGINLVKRLKKFNTSIQFVMLSQVSDKNMIAKSYEAGVEFYISKPINAIEVQTVISKVIEKIDNQRKIDTITGLLANAKSPFLEVPSYDIESVYNTMKRIGLIGETGSKDIIDVVTYILENNLDMNELRLKDIFSKFSKNPKTIEQRIRRTAYIGLVNLANIGIEDYMNEIFTEYSNVLYNFDQVRLEMNNIRGISSKQATVNIRKFLEGLVMYGKNN